jgi:hypothetical protein
MPPLKRKSLTSRLSVLFTLFGATKMRAFLIFAVIGTLFAHLILIDSIVLIFHDQ